jgi:hypothetical protein
MRLFSRPWFRLTAAGVLGLVGIFVVSAVLIMKSEPDIRLPFADDLQSQPHVLPTWDHDISRARYVEGGYELLVKGEGRKAYAVARTWHEWDMRIEVTIDFRGVRGDWPEDGPAPTAGVICPDGTLEAAPVETPSYDFRVGPDGRYAIYRWDLPGPRGEARLIASNRTAGQPRIAVNTPVRLVVECQRRKPTTLRLSIDGRQLLVVQDEAARFWGRGGLIVGAGNERNVSAVFRDLKITGH